MTPRGAGIGGVLRATVPPWGRGAEHPAAAHRPDRSYHPGRSNRPIRSCGPVQNAVPLARLPPDDWSVLMVVCSTQLPVALASGLRFIDTPSVPDSDEGYV